MAVDIFNEITKECINFAKEKEYQITIKKNLIEIKGANSIIKSEEVFNKYEDIMYFLINKNTDCEKYLIENNMPIISLKLYKKLQ